MNYWFVVTEKKEIVEFATGEKPAPLPVAQNFAGNTPPPLKVVEVSRETYFKYLYRGAQVLREVMESV